MRQALLEGHEGDALTNRIAELEAHPTQFIIDASDDLAEGRCLLHGSWQQVGSVATSRPRLSGRSAV